MKTVLLSWYDYILFFLTIALSAAIGIYFGCFKKQNTTADYLHGGNKMKVFPVAMSTVAGSVSSIALVGVPAEVYLFGAQYSIMLVSIALIGFAINYIYLPVLFKLRTTSVFEYLELRFDKRIRSIASGLMTFTYFSALPVTMYVPSLVVNQVTGFNIYTSAISMSLVCIFYTTISGIKGVVFADNFQFIITLSTFFCILILGTSSIGGLSEVWEKAKLGERLEFFNMNPDPTVRSTFWNVFIGNFFFWVFFSGIAQGSVQRLVAVPTYRDSQKVLIISIAFTIITKFIGCFAGLIAFAKYYDCDPLTAGLMQKPDQILPFYVMDIAQQLPGIGGLFLAGLCTTALSTFSTALNACAGLLYRDFVEPCMCVKMSEKSASTLMKMISLVTGLLATGLLFVVDRLGTIFQIGTTVGGSTAGPILGLFTVGMLLPWVNAKGAFAGLIVSLIVVVVVVGGNQYYILNGAFKPTYKPLSTYGCNFTVEAVTSNIASVAESSYQEEEPFWLFRISFYYFVALGAIVTVVVSATVSALVKQKQKAQTNPDLFAPCIHRFLPKTYTQDIHTPDEGVLLS